MTVKCDLHIHSDYSDGTSSIEEIAQRAATLGLKTIAITDHFWPAFKERKSGLGLIKERRREIEEMRMRYPHMVILDGAEADIEPDGTLTPIAGGLDQFDILIGSIHYMCDSQQWASIITMALSKRPFDVIGHCDGYLSSYREEDGRVLAEALSEHGVVIELSVRYPPRIEEFLVAARDLGCQFTFGSDAHEISSIGQFDFQEKLAASFDLPTVCWPFGEV